MKICQVRNTTVTKKKKKKSHQPFLTFSVVQLLRYSGRTFPMLPFSGNICMTSRPDSLAKVNRERERERDQHFNSRSNLKQVTCASISIWSHTSPAEGTGQLAAQEATSDDSDGIDVSGNLIQRLEVLNLRREKNWHSHLPGQPSMLCQWHGCYSRLTSQ